MLMAYDEAGTGPPVLLLHAGVADRRMWEAQWEPLSRRHRVIRCDLRGFGDTPLPPERFGFASDVVALLDRLGVHRASIVGSSFGGRVALEVATVQPDRVERLALLCSALRGLLSTPAMDAFDEQEEALLAADDRDGCVELNVRTWVGPEADDDSRSLVRLMQRRAVDVQLAAEQRSGPVAADPVDVDPASVVAPTLVVSGAHDLDFFQHVADHLASAMPHAERVHLPWAGHLPSMERPAEVRELLSAHLAR